MLKDCEFRRIIIKFSWFQTNVVLIMDGNLEERWLEKSLRTLIFHCVVYLMFIEAFRNPRRAIWLSNRFFQQSSRHFLSETTWTSNGVTQPPRKVKSEQLFILFSTNMLETSASSNYTFTSNLQLEKHLRSPRGCHLYTFSCRIGTGKRASTLCPLWLCDLANC